MEYEDIMSKVNLEKKEVKEKENDLIQVHGRFLNAFRDYQMNVNEIFNLNELIFKESS